MIGNIFEYVPACMFIIYPQACTEIQFSFALTCAGLSNFIPTVCLKHFYLVANTDASHLVVYRIAWAIHQCVLLFEHATLSVEAEAHQFQSQRLYGTLLPGGKH